MCRNGSTAVFVDVFFSRHRSPLLEHLLKYPDAPFLVADACILKADIKNRSRVNLF